MTGKRTLINLVFFRMIFFLFSQTEKNLFSYGKEKNHESSKKVSAKDYGW